MPQGDTVQLDELDAWRIRHGDAGLLVARALRALGFHGADWGQRRAKQGGGTGTTRYIIP